MNDTQKQYVGFFNTPLLWAGNAVFNLHQFNIQPEKTLHFTKKLDSKLRLGKRVERFVSFNLQSNPSISLIAENVQIQNEKITLGELDFLFQKNNQTIHLEVVYKFYLFDNSVGSSEIEHWIGPNRKDSLLQKLNKLTNKQLPLLKHQKTQTYLQTLPLEKEQIAKIEQYVLFKAQLFIPFHTKLVEIPFQKLNKTCFAGFYLNFNQLNLLKNCKFYIPSKVNWLVEIEQNTKWLNYLNFKQKVLPIINEKTSPLCWIKNPNGTFLKCFIVWW